MKEHTLSWEEINKTKTNSTQRCISQWSYEVCWKRNPNKVRNSSIDVFRTLKKIGPEFTKCLVPNSPGPENIWSRIHHLVPSSLGPEFTWSRIHLIQVRRCRSWPTNQHVQWCILLLSASYHSQPDCVRGWGRICEYDTSRSRWQLLWGATGQSPHIQRPQLSGLLAQCMVCRNIYG